MALLIDADGERVNVGTMDGWTPSVYSAFGWIYPTDIGSGNVRVVYGKHDQIGSFLGTDLQLDDSDGLLACIVRRATQPTVYRVNPSPFTEDAWQFFGVSVDVSASNQNKIKFYRGTLTSAPVQHVAGTRTEGNGAVIDYSALPMILGGNDINDNQTFRGRIASIGFVDATVLTLADFTRLWRRSPPGSLALKGYWELGYAADAASAQPDWSGHGYNGTVQGGATLTDHVPRVFRRAGPLYVPYAVAAAGGGFVPFPPQMWRSGFGRDPHAGRPVASRRRRRRSA